VMVDRSYLASAARFGTLLLLLVSGCTSGRQESQPLVSKTTTPAAASLPKFSELPAAELNRYHVKLDTVVGDIEIAFYAEHAPEHVRTFLRLCQLGFYDHTAWHRVVRGFVIQGGDLSTRRPPLSPAEIDYYSRPLKAEISRLKHEKGTLSMARGEGANEATTSFFICLQPQPALNGKYTIFGRVVSGMDVVDRLSSVSLGERDRPRQRWELRKTEIFEADKTERKEKSRLQPGSKTVIPVVWWERGRRIPL
jgi:peptidyl-prolyl cis-trans isomerase B (cyclophilin B)